MNIEISDLAYLDIENILQYSIETFGFAKAEEYSDGIFKKIIYLSSFPDIGHRHNQLSADFRVCNFEKHITLYTS
jgi:plasmid stabilization system protein ParE